VGTALELKTIVSVTQWHRNHFRLLQMSSNFERTGFEELGRSHTHPGHFTGSSSFTVRSDGVPVKWNPMVEVPSGEVFAGQRRQMRRRNSIRATQEKDAEAIPEKTIEEEMAEVRCDATVCLSCYSSQDFTLLCWWCSIAMALQIGSL